MNLLIIGAGGKLGKSLLNKLLIENEYKIGIFVRTPLKSNNHNFVEFIGNLTHKDTINSAVQWADIIINCSGKVSYSIWWKEKLYFANVVTVKNILSACEKYKKPLIHAGSAASYGLNTKPVFHKEDIHTKSTGINLPLPFYFFTKRKAEELIQKSSIQFIILRMSSIVFEKKSTYKKLQNIAKMGFSLSLNGGVNFVNEKDVIDAFIFAIKLLRKNPNQKEIFNIGGENISIKEFYKKHAKPKSIHLPIVLLYLLSISDLFIGWYKSFISFETIYILQNYCYIDTSKYKNALSHLEANEVK